MLELQSTTLSSLGTAIIAMIIVCILFIGDSAIVFWVVFTMISMDIGIAGFLSLWGADLDPTTVVNILVRLISISSLIISNKFYIEPLCEPMILNFLQQMANLGDQSTIKSTTFFSLSSEIY
ncbi:unnamed protein product [Anisakis simplex]|uniref:Uncharacterized protein n=1 Tax=Anisakis simplex TaxID=6269 RepID=A0A0M3JLV5_ANISI|nr:unnamed protein product [Anisakis simplex]